MIFEPVLLTLSRGLAVIGVPFKVLGRPPRLGASVLPYALFGIAAWLLRTLWLAGRETAERSASIWGMLPRQCVGNSPSSVPSSISKIASALLTEYGVDQAFMPFRSFNLNTSRGPD